MAWTGAPLAELEAAYRARGRAQSGDRPIVGYIGSDTPDELILATGFQPMALLGDPERETPTADIYLGPMVDGMTRSLFEGLVNGAYGDLAGLVIARDGENYVRLFYALRALRKMDPEVVKAVPPFHFLDLLHMPHRTSGLYNRVRLRELQAMLEGWAGAHMAEGALAAAVALRNENRRRLDVVRALGGGPDPRLTGTEALRAVLAGRVLPVERHNDLLLALFAELPSRAPLPGRRVFITGSGQDHAGLYELIESCGAIIVGDDHAWGDRDAETRVDETVHDPIEAIADHRQFAPPIGAKYSVAERAAYTAASARAAGAEAVISVVYDGDPGPRWDVPAQREALGGIPLLLLDDQPYLLADARPVRGEVIRFLETLA